MRQISSLTPTVFAALASLSATAFAASPAGAPPSVANLRCEHKVDPLGIDVAQPRLSWQLRSDARGVVQSAYQLEVTRDGRRVWDTGKVALGPLRPRPVRRPRARVLGPLHLAGAGVGRRREALGLERARALGDGAAVVRGLEGPLDRGGPGRGREGVPAGAGAARDLRGEGEGALRPRLRHQPRPLRAGDQREARGRPALHPRLDELPPPPAVPDVRRHGPPARGRERDRRDARRRLVPRLPRLEGQAGRLRGPPRAAVPAADRVRGRADGDGGDGRDLEVDDGADPVVGHLQRRDLRRAARASRLERPRPPGRRLGGRGRGEAARAVSRRPRGPARPADRGDPPGEGPEDARRRDGRRHGPEHGGPRPPEGEGPGGDDGDPAPRRGARQGRQLLHRQPPRGEAAGDSTP